MDSYEINDIVKCEVTGVTEYGVFVKLENGYDGLIHISEISNKYVNNLEKKYTVNDIIDAQVIEVDNDKKQVKLSIKRMKSKKPIEEIGDGFKPLKENLKIWIDEKMNELNN